MSLTIQNLSQLLRQIDKKLRIETLESLDPLLAGKVIEGFNVHMQAECLYNISEKQREGVVGLFNREKAAQALKKLEY